MACQRHPSWIRRKSGPFVVVVVLQARSTIFAYFYGLLLKICLKMTKFVRLQNGSYCLTFFAKMCDTCLTAVEATAKYNSLYSEFSSKRYPDQDKWIPNHQLKFIW